mgnify:CR=1 FL=1
MAKKGLDLSRLHPDTRLALAGRDPSASEGGVNPPVQHASTIVIENAADLYGVALMNQIGGDPRALGSLLQRIAGTHAGPKILLDHPETRDRVAAIEAAAGTAAGTAPRRPLLDQAEWAALKSICAGE